MATIDHARHGRSFGIAAPGFRLADGAHVGMVRLQVSDLPRSLEYYRQVLGFHVHAVTADTAALAPQRDHRVLLSLQTRPGVTRARRGSFGLFHFALLLPDRAALGRFAAHLAPLDARVRMADHRVSEALYLWDPDGLGIEVYADRPRETWEHEGRQLVMTTEPLEMSDLIAAGGGHAWEGMLGTNIWSPGPAPAPDHARLLQWELVVPHAGDVSGAARSIRDAGYPAEETDGGCTATDPWGTRVRIVSSPAGVQIRRQ